MAFSAHAGTSTSIPGSVIFDEGHSFSIIPAPTPTPKLGRRWRTKQHEKGPERFPELDDEVYLNLPKPTPFFFTGSLKIPYSGI